MAISDVQRGGVRCHARPAEGAVAALAEGGREGDVGGGDVRAEAEVDEV